MRKTLFRQEAVEAAVRLDDLQTSIRVARPATLLTAGALAFALVGTTVASAFVEVPIHVDGIGVFVSDSGTLVVPVMTLSSGYVSEVATALKARVEKGAVLAHLTLPDRAEAVLKSEREVAAMARDLELQRKLNAADAAVETQSFDRQAEAMRARVAGLRTKVETLAKRLDGLGKLQADGVISLVSLQTAEISYQEAVDELSSAEAGLLELAATREKSTSARKRDLMATAAALEQAQLELEADRTALEADSTIKAPTSGIVTSINTQLGGMTSPGASMFEITPTGTSLPMEAVMRAAIFVPLEEGKRVAKDDLVLLTPKDLPEGVTARVVARVSDVAETPASSARLTRLLGDDALQEQFMQHGPVFEVTVEPQRTPGGDLVWRSAEPEGVDPTIGTPLTARVTVETRPLLALAIPAFKNLLGADKDLWADPAN